MSTKPNIFICKVACFDMISRHSFTHIWLDKEMFLNLKNTKHLGTSSLWSDQFMFFSFACLKDRLGDSHLIYTLMKL